LSKNGLTLCILINDNVTFNIYISDKIYKSEIDDNILSVKLLSKISNRWTQNIDAIYYRKNIYYIFFEIVINYIYQRWVNQILRGYSTA